LTDDEREAEALLGRLRAAPPPNLTASRVLIEAERRRGRRQLWAWRGVAAALGAGLVLELTLRHSPRAEPAAVPANITVSEVRTTLPHVKPRHFSADLALLTGDDYIATRNRSVAFGVRPLLAPPSSEPQAAAPHVAPRESNSSQPPTPLLLQLLGGWRTGGRS